MAMDKPFYNLFVNFQWQLLNIDSSWWISEGAVYDVRKIRRSEIQLGTGLGQSQKFPKFWQTSWKSSNYIIESHKKCSKRWYSIKNKVKTQMCNKISP